MSTRYSSNGKRLSSMTHAKRAHSCSCGKVVMGNGGKSGHRRACDGRWLTTTEAYEARKAAFYADPAAPEEADPA